MTVAAPSMISDIKWLY